MPLPEDGGAVEGCALVALAHSIRCSKRFLKSADDMTHEMIRGIAIDKLVRTAELAMLVATPVAGMLYAEVSDHNGGYASTVRVGATSRGGAGSHYTITQ